MASWSLQVPSKTFVLGEYAVLEGGPCLGAATSPCFEMVFRESDRIQTLPAGIHPDSPAGNFFSDHKNIFETFDGKFFDPLAGMGGFGASTAQYLGLWGFREMVIKKRSYEDLLKSASIKEMIHEYRNFSSRKNGRVPSGADLVMQLFGGFTWINSSSWEVQKLNWPWSDQIGFFISTGNKVSTHTHLQDLSDFNPSELFRVLQQSRSDLKAKKADHWLESIGYYSQALGLLGLVAPETLALVQTLRSWPGVKAAKGCGAMGADVVFCVVDSMGEEEFQSHALKNQLRIVASTKNFSLGLTMKNAEVSKTGELSHD